MYLHIFDAGFFKHGWPSRLGRRWTASAWPDGILLALQFLRAIGS